MAESLDFIATKLEAEVKGGKTLNAAIQELHPTIVKESKKVLFNGNGYSEDWHKEAEKRGLPNLKSTTDVLPVFPARTRSNSSPITRFTPKVNSRAGSTFSAKIT